MWKLGVPKGSLLEVEAGGTNGQLAGGGKLGARKDSLLEMEAAPRHNVLGVEIGGC